MTSAVAILIIAVAVLFALLVRKSGANSIRARSYTRAAKREERASTAPVEFVQYSGEDVLVLPDLSGRVEEEISVRSATEAGVNYTVNLAFCTCTCPDWQKGREGFAVTDVRRVCKHINAQLRSHLELFDEFTRVFLAALPGGVPTDSQFARVDLLGRRVVFAFRPGHFWIDVVTLNRSKVRTSLARFGFNAQEKRWSYGTAPRNAGAIRQIITKLGIDKVAATPATEHEGPVLS